MNLKDNSRKYVLLSTLILGLAVFLITFSYLTEYKQQIEENKKQILGAISKIVIPKNTRENLKSLRYKELSSDNSHEIIVYQIRFDPTLYNDYYKDYFPNNTIIAVKDIKTNREDYLFVGEERTGDPHWIDNKYVFFTDYCGTACKGMYLVNTAGKITKHAVISYFFEKDGPWQTHFRDWFGKEFVFDGLIDEIKSEMLQGKSYLVFEMKDGHGNPLGEKRFLFQENSLKLL